MALALVYCFIGMHSAISVGSIKPMNLTQQGIEYDRKYHPFKLLNLSTKRQISDDMLMNFRASIEGAVFSGVFGDNAVLQREPFLSSLYGAADTSNAQISVTITQNDGNYHSTLTTNSDTDSNWKVVLNEARPNGGNYTISVQCPGCINPTISNKYTNITFGDVYYCSGQSNMELDMHFTFNRNITYESILNGKYRNIRYKTQYEIDTSNMTYVIPYNSNPQYQWQQVRDEVTNISLSYSLDKFSAPCWYFAQSLDDIYGLTNITFGLIDVAVGGSMIEQWIKNQTVQLFCKYSNCPDVSCGGLYNGLVAPYLNMTIKSYLWYQGENNVYEEPGSWYNNTGYGCMEPFMLRQWRSEWSVIPNTTSPTTPFGLVQLAGGTSEGHGQNMGRFRWTQFGSFDYLPNSELTNVFGAQAYDAADPWGKQCYYIVPSPCQGDVPYSWNATHYYMGPIHPRPKLIIGQRLAHSGYPILYQNNPNGINNEINIGPTVAGCKVNNLTQEIVIQFNKTLSILPSGNNNGIQSDGKIHVDPFVAWYNNSVNWTIVDNWSALQIEYNKVWYYVPMIKEGNDGISVIADISNMSDVIKDINQLEGIRYAWLEGAYGHSEYDYNECCGTLNTYYYPCPPNSCPIKSGIGNNSLPAVPFWAKIVNQTCECFEPQTCNSMSGTK